MQRVDNSTYLVTEPMVESSSLERLHIVCKINSIPNILGFNSMNIYRVNKNGNIEHLATMRSSYPEIPGYQRPELVQSSSTMQAVGVYNDKNPTLGISVPVASLTCNDGLMYNCSLVYDERQGSSTPVTKMSSVARNLTVSVQPKDVELRAFNQSSSLPMEILNDSGTVSTNMASFMVGQMVKLTCKANFGTRSNGLISWRKSSIVAGSGIADYIPNNNEREDGQVVANGCQFEKTDSIMYNMTEQDAIRTSNNPLQFQCYISIPGSSVALPETTVKNFYIKVLSTTTETTVKTTTDAPIDKNTSTVNSASGVAEAVAGAVALLLLLNVLLLS
ncbi:uncharacterized protein LOC127835301 isoform X2 [Dreissena polymorpha]|uniref:uncharacterized protein LOC127835301 isoform X2 n=1 Tax=Dreissena polymorpha TaxID=45954 RepID=UPI0022644EFB|nr:uncharacterized protein LOC127835301 isoform X2 [Dreissena polymorpha]